MQHRRSSGQSDREFPNGRWQWHRGGGWWTRSGYESGPCSGLNARLTLMLGEVRRGSNVTFMLGPRHGIAWGMGSAGLSSGRFHMLSSYLLKFWMNSAASCLLKCWANRAQEKGDCRPNIDCNCLSNKLRTFRRITSNVLTNSLTSCLSTTLASSGCKSPIC
jgi:hypothetical protein